MRLIFSLFLALASIVSFAQGGSMPIFLSLPMDGDTINETEPTFVWQANLSTIQSDPRFTLNLTIVKLDANQTATEGIVENIPIQVYANLLSNTIQYSASAPAIERNVWYAWQLVLYYNGMEVRQSEVWKFILANETPEISNSIVLRRTADNTIYNLEGNTVNLLLDERGISNLTAVVTDKLNHKFNTTLDLVKNVNDVSIYNLNVSDLNLKKGIYRLDWIPSKDLNYILYFEK